MDIIVKIIYGYMIKFRYFSDTHEGQASFLLAFALWYHKHGVYSRFEGEREKNKIDTDRTLYFIIRNIMSEERIYRQKEEALCLRRFIL